MEYQGKPLNLELINDIVEITSIECVLELDYRFIRLTNGFKEPYVMLLLTKAKDWQQQLLIFNSMYEIYKSCRNSIDNDEWANTECIREERMLNIEFQLKFKHKAFEPDLGVLVQAYIYRQFPKRGVSKLKGDWYYEEDIFGDVFNWVNDRCILGTVALMHEPYCEDSRINQELYDLRMKNWSSRENVEDFLEILDPVCEGKSLLDSYEFKQFYQNLFQDPWTLDPTTPYAQKRQSIIDDLLAEHQCSGNAKKAESQYENREEVNKVFIEHARQNSELQKENDALKSESANIEELKNRIKQLEDEKAERHELVAIAETAKSKILAQIALFADLLHVPLCPPTNISAFSELVGKVSGWKTDSVRSKINKNIDYSKAKAEIEEFAAIIDRISSDCKPIAEQMRNNVR